MSDVKELTLTVCRLVAYLVANVVKDDKEYQEWGLPFIRISVEAQFGEEVGRIVAEEMNSKFCPIIGHGLSLQLEDVENEDFTLVHSAEQLLCAVLNEADVDGADFDQILKVYMDKFFQHIMAKCTDGVYDARVRVIARRLCDSLNITAAEFGDLEEMHWKSSGNSGAEIGTSAAVLSTSVARRAFHESFNKKSASIPRSSILASFRIWRVAFIATGGGALMALCGRIAAPAIVNTVLPLLFASTTVGQVAMCTSTVLSCFGLTSLELIPGIMSSYAATVAGTKMLHRTAPLNDFCLKPLHLDDTERGLTKVKSGSSSESTNEGVSSKAVEATSLSERLPVQNTRAPVFILVSGHLERGIDARQLWGADGFLRTVRYSKDTLLDEVRKIVTVKVVPLATTHLFAGDTEPGEEQHKSDALVQTSIPLVGESAGGPEAAVIVAQPPETTEPGQPTTNPSSESLTDWEELTSNVQGWWRETVRHGEEYVLHWEPSVLEQLNESLQRILINKMLGKLKGLMKGEILKFTPIPAIRAAATLPLMLMDKINELDDPWVVAMDRANQAGKLLARVLLAEHRRNRLGGSGSHSHDGGGTDSLNSSGMSTTGSGMDSPTARVVGRPITLVGYGMGARLIFHCLETLASEGGADGRGIVENAVLIGSPVSMDSGRWQAARSVVAGRLINCYAWNDWMLALLYRSKSYEIGVAGLYPIHLGTGTAVSGTTKAVRTTATSATGGQKAGGVSSDVAADSSANGAAALDCDVDPAQCPTAADHFTAGLERAMGGGETLGEQSSSVPPFVPRLTLKHYNSALEVENHDVSDLISSHSDYPVVLPTIITRLKL